MDHGFNLHLPSTYTYFSRCTRFFRLKIHVPFLFYLVTLCIDLLRSCISPELSFLKSVVRPNNPLQDIRRHHGKRPPKNTIRSFVGVKLWLHKVSLPEPYCMQEGNNGVMSRWLPALESHALSAPVQLAASASAQRTQNRGLERKIGERMRGEKEGRTI